MFPEADIPVIQLSIDHRLDVTRHHALGRSLAELRDEGIASVVSQHDTKQLLSLCPASHDGGFSHPTPDHWLPLIYAQAASDDQDRVRFATQGCDWGSISMRNIIFG